MDAIFLCRAYCIVYIVASSSYFEAWQNYCVDIPIEISSIYYYRFHLEIGVEMQETPTSSSHVQINSLRILYVLIYII